MRRPRYYQTGLVWGGSMHARLCIAQSMLIIMLMHGQGLCMGWAILHRRHSPHFTQGVYTGRRQLGNELNCSRAAPLYRCRLLVTLCMGRREYGVGRWQYSAQPDAGMLIARWRSYGGRCPDAKGGVATREACNTHAHTGRGQRVPGSNLRIAAHSLTRGRCGS